MHIPKTQVLITNVSKELFEQGWPRDLDRELFEQKFPSLKPQLCYYTPLGFLSRIVIIFKDEQSALQVFQYLQGRVTDQQKVYLSESLLAKPPSHSDGEVEQTRPQLSLNTSSDVASPTLSPERTDSPTLLKFDNQSELHPYQEPLPKEHAESLVHGTRCLWEDLEQPLSPSITLDEFRH
ncbi:RCN2 (YOR220W) [Zygosaccharomyces parabailii]|nr:RCN2 (YOR220W) [Zygosaccharomyces parabailii]CDH08745.1 uncharacterized protein ZBAI_00527 [Zygosaccharomyces bailii ISA1307]